MDQRRDSIHATIRHPNDHELQQVIELSSDLPSADDPQRWSAEFSAGRLRAEWTWAAFSTSGEVVGRLLLWAPADKSEPVSLEMLDVNAPDSRRQATAVGLLAAARRELCHDSSESLPNYELRLPVGWRQDQVVGQAVDWRLGVLRSVGMVQANERLQLEWGDAMPLPTKPTGLHFRTAEDLEFLALFEAAARGSLDVATRMDLLTMTPAKQATADFEFYRDCPGERSWWRVAADRAGVAVGFVIPSATPYHRNIGYLAVLPEFRGRGFVDELLCYATRFHAGQGAPGITATTDVVNEPMAAAFARAGYEVTEIRLVVAAK